MDVKGNSYQLSERDKLPLLIEPYLIGSMSLNLIFYKQFFDLNNI